MAVHKKAAKKKVVSKKAKLKIKAKAKPKKKAGGMLKAARNLHKTTKKMVDDVFLKLVGMRVLERAQQMSASLKEEKAKAESLKKKTSAKAKKG